MQYELNSFGDMSALFIEQSIAPVVFSLVKMTEKAVKDANMMTK